MNVRGVRRGRRAVRSTAVVVGALCAGPITAAAAQTFTVQGFGDPTIAPCVGSVCPSLRDAVVEANNDPGSTIQLQAGTFKLGTEALLLKPPVTISGAGPGGGAGTTIDQTDAFSAVLQATSGLGGSGTLAVDGVEVTGGTTLNDLLGGGISQENPAVTLVLNNDLIDDNTIGRTDGRADSNPDGIPTSGGGIYSAGPLRLTDTVVSDNHALAGNGADFSPATPDPGGNGADAEGGGIYAVGPTTITGGTFSDNTAISGHGGEGAGDGNAGGKGGSGAGGAIFVASTGQLTISSTTFSGNTATGGAGGIPQAIAAPGDNGTGEGGAISTAGALTLTGSQLTGNNVAGGDASPTVLGVSVKAGGAGEGGGIFTSANATITDSTISGNHATGGTGGSSTSVGAAGGVADGGGIFTSSAFVSTIRSTTLATNAVTGGPGGNNSGGTSPGPDGAARGGAVFHQSGSVLLPGEQPALIIDSTITGNDATGTSNASGGGLATTGTLGVHLASDTLAANVAADGDTLFSVPGGVNSTFTVQDTILAANASGAAVNCDAHVSDSGHNLEDSGATTSTCGLSSANNDVLVVPGTAGLASALASNGGPTQTLALSGTSSAVAAGGACTDPGSNGVALAVDQRGLPRQAPCDIGAFEGQRPVSTAAPSITGTAAAGDMLTCAPGTFSGEGNLTVAFAWLRDGSPIGSATSATYVVQTADGGHAVACKVTATGTYGSASATSATVSVPSPTAQIGTPTVHRQTDKVSKKGATNVKVGCTGPGSCSGTLQLTATATTHRHHKTHHRHVAIAKATFTIPADRTTPVSMHLTKTGRRLLNITAGHKLHLTITVNSGKRVIASAKGTLRLASKPRPKHA